MRLAAATLLATLAACGTQAARTEPAGGGSGPTAGGPVVLATFEGFADPRSGQISITAVQSVAAPGAGVHANAVEIPSGGTVLSIANDTNANQAAWGTTGPRQVAVVSGTCGTATQVFEGYVKVTNLAASNLGDTFVQITSITTAGREACNSDGPASSGLSATNGLWDYGTLASNESVSVLWRFTAPDATAFRFVGKVFGTTGAAAPTWAALPTGAMLNTSYALKSDRTLWAWGSNADGDLASGAVDSGPHSTPTKIGTGFSQVSGRRLGLKTNGTVVAWGVNDFGQMGDGTTDANVHRFTVIPGLSGTITKVAGGDRTSYALSSGGTLYAWGRGTTGELGVGGTGANSAVPVTVPPDAATVGGWKDVAAGGGALGIPGFVIATSDKSATVLKCPFGWGNDGVGQTGTKNGGGKGGGGGSGAGGLPVFSPIQTNNNCFFNIIAAGANHGHAVQVDAIAGGAIAYYGWGRNNFGQIGDSTSSDSNVPTGMAAQTFMTATAFLAAGDSHAMAVTPAGALWGWGDDLDGQLGIPSTGSATAVSVGASTWSTVAGGAVHSLGIQPGGTLWATGTNSVGQLGITSTSGIQDGFVQVP